jgi:type IX secretion system PorP/SprF family membrane protein
MKRFIAIISVLVLGVSATRAQQIATSSLYDMQGVFHNPSVAGVNKYGSIGATYRSMWSGIDGSPKTTTVFGSAYLPSVKLGLGGYLYNDVTGPTRRTGLQMAYAYHVPLQNDASFSLGIEGRFQQYSIDKGKLGESLGANDPVLAGAGNRFSADAGFGLSYTSRKFQAGASVSNLIQSKLDFYSGDLSRSETGRLYRHYYFHSRYNWDVDGNTVITPNILFIYLPNAPLEFQGGARVEHREVFWWGVSMRLRQSWMLSAGVKVKKKLVLGYSFDIYSTPLSIYDRGSNAHEILLRYDFLK